MAYSFGIELREFGFTSAGQTGKDDEGTCFEADVIIIDGFVIKVVAFCRNVALDMLKQVAFFEQETTHLVNNGFKFSLRELSNTNTYRMFEERSNCISRDFLV